MEFNPEFIPEFIPESTHELIDLLDRLIKNSCIPEERKEKLYSEIFKMNYEECVNLVVELQEKQIDRITSGLNYNMTEIIKHLKKLK